MEVAKQIEPEEISRRFSAGNVHISQAIPNDFAPKERPASIRL